MPAACSRRTATRISFGEPSDRYDGSGAKKASVL